MRFRLLEQSPLIESEHELLGCRTASCLRGPTVLCRKMFPTPCGSGSAPARRPGASGSRPVQLSRPAAFLGTGPATDQQPRPSVASGEQIQDFLGRHRGFRNRVAIASSAYCAAPGNTASCPTHTRSRRRSGCATSSSNIATSVASEHVAGESACRSRSRSHRIARRLGPRLRARRPYRVAPRSPRTVPNLSHCHAADAVRESSRSARGREAHGTVRGAPAIGRGR